MHPQFPEAFESAQQGDWSLLQSILGYEYVQTLRIGPGGMLQENDQAVITYIARAYGVQMKAPPALPPPSSSR
jgi:hypothetical protein